MKIVIIDNYDSFTYNLSHLVKELGAEVTVVRNDQFKLEDLEQFSKIILSPGPGIPSEAGLLLDVIKTYAGKKPILGVCLGHQAIGEAFGAKLENLSDVFHGGCLRSGTERQRQPYYFKNRSFTANNAWTERNRCSRSRRKISRCCLLSCERYGHCMYSGKC